jgi:hypothetical protein
MNNEDNFDIIDPETMADALAEAQGKPIEQGVTILELLNKTRIKVRYMPQSVASSFDYDDGTPIQRQVRKPKFDYRKWSKETFPKMNALALLNIQIVDDVAKPDEILPKNGVRLSLISIGEFKRLNKLCFPGAGEDTSDSEDEADVTDRPRGKGLRGRKPVVPSEQI